MAEHIIVNSMAGGDTVAADEISSVKYQRIKVVVGADGVNDGDVSSANPLPVNQTAALPAGDNNIGNVDVVTLPALAAGTNAIGKLAANSGVDIGDVTLNNLTTTPVYTQSNITGIANNRKVVTTAGTAVALAATTACKRVTITAETDNTGVIVVGGSGVVAALATRQGVPLNAGDTYELDITDLASVYIDSTVNGDGVTFTYLT